MKGVAAVQDFFFPYRSLQKVVTWVTTMNSSHFKHRLGFVAKKGCVYVYVWVSTNRRWRLSLKADAHITYILFYNSTVFAWGEGGQLDSVSQQLYAVVTCLRR